MCYIILVMEETDEKLTTGNKIFYIVLVLLILGSVGFTFLRIVVWKDYQVVAEVSCDPATELCFHYEPEPCAEGDTACLALPPEEAYDYKLISKKAATIYNCQIKKFSSPEAAGLAGCGEELSCVENEEDCSYTFCDPENLAEGEVCSVPAEDDVKSVEDTHMEIELE